MGSGRITLKVDGHVVEATSGESVAAALVRSGRYLFGRSVKYHRPRGPVCMRGRCDGCLMRVDGRPNVMTCREPAREGMQVETQNVLGSAKRDLLALTDWLYPDGLDHHSMWTRFRPTNELMKLVARKVAGVGTLPTRDQRTDSVVFESTDVLVVGAGHAGVAAANEAARLGAQVVLVDEGPVPGGEAALVAYAQEALVRAPLPSLGPPVRFMAHHTAVALFEERPDGSAIDEGALVLLERAPGLAMQGGLVAMEARRVIIATGVVGGALAFEGNDMPGVFTASGALTLLAAGVVPETVALVGEGPLLEQLNRLCESRRISVVATSSVQHVVVRGGQRAERIVIDGESHGVDWVVAGAPPSAALELAVQGGAESRWQDGGFFVIADDDGRTASDVVLAVGSCAGRRGPPASDQGRRAGALAARRARSAER